MNPNDPAFPSEVCRCEDCRGIRVRLYIATHALQGFLSADWDVPYNEMALQALKAADALIEQEKNH